MREAKKPAKMRTDHTLQAKPRILDFMDKISEMEAMEEFKDCEGYHCTSL